ncbi:MAG: nucleotidyl transferase AbiEii/AbiGii toxin family protein [bacterium]|nr:nucleotidyl transferase AbiEii/AbiGii toxin family protein [bacterium]
MPPTLADIDRYHPGLPSELRTAIASDAMLDHALGFLSSAGVFEACDLVLKGGTAARKFRLAEPGRLSFDLDFDGPEGAQQLVVEALQGAQWGGFEFSVVERRCHHTLISETPFGFTCAAGLDFSSRGRWEPPQALRFNERRLHEHYDEELPTVPVMTVDETVAEKLSRWQHDPLIRDLHDLVALHRHLLSPEAVTEMWVLKCHQAMTAPRSRHPTGARAAEPDTLLTPVALESLVLDDLVFTQVAHNAAKPQTVARWLAEFPALFAFTAMIPTTLREVAADRGAREWEAGQMIDDYRRRAAERETGHEGAQTPSPDPLTP